MLNEFVYCPRLFFLEHVDGLFAHNADTIEGASKHRRVDKKTDSLPAGTQAQADETIHARSVMLSSDRYGIVAKLDLVETRGDLATPVDYKRGKPKKLADGSQGAWDPERVQICAQALVLRENGYRCDEGVLFFWETRQRVRIPIDDELVKLTATAIAAAHQTMDSHQMPPPLLDSPKCPRCSLVNICLPDETSRCASTSIASPETPTAQPLLFNIGPQFEMANPFSNAHATKQKQPVRQLITARDEKRPLYLSTHGHSVGISSQVLQIKEKRKVIKKIRLHDVNQLNVFGNIQLTTQAIGDPGIEA